MKFKEWITKSYKTIVVGIGVVGTLGVIWTTSTTVYSAGEEIKNVKKNVLEVKESQLQSIKAINDHMEAQTKRMDLQMDAIRLQLLTDTENNIDVAIQSREAKGKSSKELKKTKEKIVKEKEEVLNKILNKTK